MSPWAILGGVVLAGSVGFGLGWKLKQAEWDATTVKAQQTAAAEEKGAANAVSEEKAKSVKVITRVKTVTREVPVYRTAECSHDVRVFDDLNRALSGTGDGNVPAGSGSTAGSDDGRNHGQAD